MAPLEDGKTYQIVQTTRSSIGAALTAQRQRIARLGRLAGAEVNQNDAYPGADPSDERCVQPPLLVTGPVEV